MSFKIGDKVICISDSCNNGVTKNKIYIVENVDSQFIYITNDRLEKKAGVYKWRFKLYKQSKPNIYDDQGYIIEDENEN